MYLLQNFISFQAIFASFDFGGKMVLLCDFFLSNFSCPLNIYVFFQAIQFFHTLGTYIHITYTHTHITRRPSSVEKYLRLCKKVSQYAYTFFG